VTGLCGEGQIVAGNRVRRTDGVCTQAEGSCWNRIYVVNSDFLTCWGWVLWPRNPWKSFWWVWFVSVFFLDSVAIEKYWQAA